MLRMDTHAHTCLSPCADLDMHPAALARAAVEAGVDGVVVCDHNAAGNVAAVRRAGRRMGLEVLAGMEVTTAEEVHIAAVLPDMEAALTLQSRVHRDLPGQNDPEAFGIQVLVNEDGEVLGFEDHLLSGATTWSLSRAVEEVHRVGGLAVAAHADRERSGLLGHLGFIPDGLPLDAVEVSPNGDLRAMGASLPRPMPILRGSDAHRPLEVGRATTFLWAEDASYPEFRRGLLGIEGRFLLGGGRPMDEIAMHVLDIAQNAVEAGARRIEVWIEEDADADVLVVEVRDDGRGMDAGTLARATDPFYTTRTTRRVGMGLSLLKAATEAAEGSLDVASEPGKGTRVRATLRLGHVDRAPLGDIETTILVLLVGNPGVSVRFRHARGTTSWELDSGELGRALDGASSSEGIAWLRAAIRRGEASLSGAGGSRGSGRTARG